MLTGILESDPDIQVVGVARNGVEALELVPRLTPDLVTMDVWMPQMDGFATVEQIMAYHPTPILVDHRLAGAQDVDISLRMLAAGALDVIEKPTRSDPAQLGPRLQDLIRQRQDARPRARGHAPQGPAPPTPRRRRRPRPMDARSRPLLPPDTAARSAPEAPAAQPAPPAPISPPVAAAIAAPKQDGVEPAVAPPAPPRLGRRGALTSWSSRPPRAGRRRCSRYCAGSRRTSTRRS